MACSDYDLFWKALNDYAFRDFFLCPYQADLGGQAFAAFLLVGLVNVPLYIRQDSVLAPTVLTLIIGGILVPQAEGVVQQLALIILLVVVGLGPVLVLRRAKRLV